MAMNLRSKNTKSLSGTSDVTCGKSNVTNATPNTATVAADSPPQEDVTRKRLAQMADFQEGWRKVVYAEFRMGARVPWDSFREDFKNIKWSRKYLDEGSGTQVTSHI